LLAEGHAVLAVAGDCAVQHDQAGPAGPGVSAGLSQLVFIDRFVYACSLKVYQFIVHHIPLARHTIYIIDDLLCMVVAGGRGEGSQHHL
jgi:hypothetical protein